VKHALVIGKLYPPTLGHHHLIRTAAAAADRVTVVIMASRWESIPLADRIAWTAAEHTDDPRVTVTGVRCDVPTDLADERVWTAQVALMRAALPADSPLVDLVVTSEPYGQQLAARFGAKHLLVDADRTAVPVSGTAVRADLAAHWDLLAPSTRAGLALRVVVLGAESTGTTSVSQQLADRFRHRGGLWGRTQWVPEHGRQATVDKQAVQGCAVEEIVWYAEDFTAIAAEQQRAEDEAAAVGSPLLVCDTDAFATTVWERRYLGSTTLVPDPPGARRLYLLTDHEGVPWVDDGMREGDLSVREAMTGWFPSALTESSRSWVLLTGSLAERVDLAERTVNLALRQAMSYTTPMPETT
jgi:HTH-type transcriptional repressor of NAD biosynthesis genes